MLTFAWHMMIADMKRTLRGWTLIIAPIFLIIALLLPFVTDLNPMSFGYFIMMTFALFRPRFSKIYHVIPMTIRQIKELIWCRLALMDAILVLVYAAVLAVCKFTNTEYSMMSGYFYLFYACANGFLFQMSLGGFKKKGGERGTAFVLLTTWMVICMIECMLGGFGLFSTKSGSETLGLCVTLGFVLSSRILGTVYMYDMAFYDYVYIPLQFYENNKKGAIERP